MVLSMFNQNFIEDATKIAQSLLAVCCQARHSRSGAPLAAWWLYVGGCATDLLATVGSPPLILTKNTLTTCYYRALSKFAGQRPPRARSARATASRPAANRGFTPWTDEETPCPLLSKAEPAGILRAGHARTLAMRFGAFNGEITKRATKFSASLGIPGHA